MKSSGNKEPSKPVVRFLITLIAPGLSWLSHAGVILLDMKYREDEVCWLRKIYLTGGGECFFVSHTTACSCCCPRL